jgi:hypothetical protein
MGKDPQGDQRTTGRQAADAFQKGGLALHGPVPGWHLPAWQLLRVPGGAAGNDWAARESENCMNRSRRLSWDHGLLQTQGSACRLGPPLPWAPVNQGALRVATALRLGARACCLPCSLRALCAAARHADAPQTERHAHAIGCATQHEGLMRVHCMMAPHFCGGAHAFQACRAGCLLQGQHSGCRAMKDILALETATVGLGANIG